MVQGGEHGGTVACPIAARIMERSLAMDEGKFEAQVAWLPPAHKANPFQMIKEVSFRDSGIDSGSGDEENANDSQGADVQMAGAGGDPDVEPEADSRGKVARRAAAASARAVPVAAPQPQRNFFQRLFGIKRQPAPASTAAAQPEAAQYHKMNLRSESLLQLVSAARLMTGQPLHFYDRQSEKDFGSSFAQDRQQARSECGETRDPCGFARGWPT